MAGLSVSFAPMEGIGTCYYRRIQFASFPEGTEKYYTPFIAVHATPAFKKRDLREIRSEENDKLRSRTVPQLLAGGSAELLWAMEKLHALGYREVNLNLGCPSGTVVKKGHGAGLLADPDKLDRLLGEIFEDRECCSRGTRLSVKTRLGTESTDEFPELLKIFSRYPLCEIIIHPRLLAEQYTGPPHLDRFVWALENTGIPLCYNGDLTSVQDIRRLTELQPDIRRVMIGRGFLRNPAIARELAGGAALSHREFRDFIARIEDAYASILPGERQTLFKLKELWFYWGKNYRTQDGAEASPYIHRIRTASDLGEYRNACRSLYRECVFHV